MSGRRSSAYIASILALISAVLIALVRLSVLGADTEIVGVEGVAMRILPSSLCGGAAVSGRVVFSNHAHM
nr:putative membrane protein [Rhodococcus sp. JVH1]